MKTKLIAILPLVILISCSDFANKQEHEFGDERIDREQPEKEGAPLPPELVNPNDGPFTRERMMYNIGLILTRTNKNFYLQSQVLTSEIEAACEKGETESAKEQFRKTVLVFQSLSAAPVGPLHDDGRMLFDHIYSWPFTNYCGIDREVIRLAETGVSNKRVLFNSKGLSAIEYLLYEDTLTSVCNSRAYPETAAWSQKSSEQKKKDRCALALDFARDVEEKATLLWRRWNPSQGHFAKKMIDNSRYDSLQMALNDLSDNLFRIEIVKDHKLGRALGMHKDCLEDKCPDQAELRYSDLSLGAIEKNIEMLETIYHGSTSPGAKGHGLDDYLRKLNRSDVADRLSLALRAAHTAASALKDQSYQKILTELDAAACAQTTRENRNVPVCALFQDIRQISILMKAELLSILDLRPPKTIEGDND